MITFSELQISSEIKRAVEEMGYQHATEIQEKAIPCILEGKDVLGRSNTGTGKTAAFGIPTIEMVKPGTKYPNALIICPTRELVTQVADELRKFSKYTDGVKVVPIYGGQSIERQIQQLKKGCGIVVGTPGRIMDHLNRRTLKLIDTNMIILDEADEMLNMGFKEDIEQILSMMPTDKHHQTILFSATWPQAILNITKDFQKDPVRVEIKSAQRTIDTVKQIYYEAPKGKKVNALRVLLQHYRPELCMIFANTKKMVDELCDELNNNNIKAISLHGDMKQEFRSRVMEQFRSGNYPILIATDVAARGIDVDNIDLVVNFDLPQDSEYYIHRIGRTGRAGRKGVAITLISGSKQRGGIRDLIRYTKTNIEKQALPTAKEMMEANRKAFIDQVKVASQNGISKESMTIANELMADGVAIEDLIGALISMTYKHEVIDVEDEKAKRFVSGVDTVTLKFDIGRSKGVKPGNIVAAIVEACKIDGDLIGRIDVRANFSLVDVVVEHVDTVLELMQGRHVKGQVVHVELDRPKKEKNKKDKKEKSNKKKERSSGRRGRSRKEHDKSIRKKKRK